MGHHCTDDVKACEYPCNALVADGFLKKAHEEGANKCCGSGAEVENGESGSLGTVFLFAVI